MTKAKSTKKLINFWNLLSVSNTEVKSKLLGVWFELNGRKVDGFESLELVDLV
jgi:hypothetical protein